MIEAVRKARIRWQCRRGMLELDLLLEQVIDHKLDNFSEEQLQTFEHLLHFTDPELYAWLMGHETAPEKDLCELIKIIQA